MQHAIEALPRPRIKRQPFTVGDIVVSKSSGQRVRVSVAVGDYFSGEFIGYRGERERPAHHRYSCNCWVASNFERETV